MPNFYVTLDFENDVRKEWDWPAQKENEEVTSYMNEFWSTLLKVTTFLKISDEEKKRKFEAGLWPHLQQTMKVHPRETLSWMIESTIIADSLQKPSVTKEDRDEMHAYRHRQNILHDHPKESPNQWPTPTSEQD